MNNKGETQRDLTPGKRLILSARKIFSVVHFLKQSNWGKDQCEAQGIKASSVNVLNDETVLLVTDVKPAMH